MDDLRQALGTPVDSFSTELPPWWMVGAFHVGARCLCGLLQVFQDSNDGLRRVQGMPVARFDGSLLIPVCVSGCVHFYLFCAVLFHFSGGGSFLW